MPHRNKDGEISIKRTEKLQVMLDDIEIQAIDDWRFKKRMPSRAAAIRELLRRGLEAPEEIVGPAPDADKSTDFMVVDPEEYLEETTEPKTAPE